MKISDIDLESYKSLDSVPLECSVCGAVFSRKKRDIVASIRRSKYAQEGEIKCNSCAITVYTEEKFCTFCNKKLENRRSEFCDHSCAAKHNNKKRIKHKRTTCERCGNRYLKSCTTECVRAQRTENWLAGRESGNGTYAILSFARDYIFQRDNNSCVICGFSGINPHSGNSILHVDHIDGDWKNSTPENLRLVCPNCHAMTENYGALNMGKGRKWKAEYSQY